MFLVLVEHSFRVWVFACSATNSNLASAAGRSFKNGIKKTRRRGRGDGPGLERGGKPQDSGNDTPLVFLFWQQRRESNLSISVQFPLEQA